MRFHTRDNLIGRLERPGVAALAAEKAAERRAITQVHRKATVLRVGLDVVRNLLGDTQLRRGGQAVLGEVLAQPGVPGLGGREVPLGLVGTVELQCYQPGREGAVGQVRGLAEVTQRRTLVAADELAHAVNEGLLLGRRDQPLEEAERQAVFR
ncbi:MAG: hypothetical protein KGY99_11150, partial [Phycisphaerae bacterium]|nr:hypothetical protein [Phycisphaerae bacterium]